MTPPTSVRNSGMKLSSSVASSFMISLTVVLAKRERSDRVLRTDTTDLALDIALDRSTGKARVVSFLLLGVRASRCGFVTVRAASRTVFSDTSDALGSILDS